MAGLQEEFYKKQLLEHTLLLEHAKNRHRIFTALRLFTFLAIIFSLYFIGWKNYLLLILVVEVALFLYFVNKWLDCKLEKEKQELFIVINNQELNLLKGDWSSFSSGYEYKSANHPFANDMDLFGTKSVFQYINRTVLPLGSTRLAETLGFGAKNKTLNQQMILELSEQIEWVQRFIVESKVFLKDDKRQQSLVTLGELDFGKTGFLFLRWLLPLVSIGSIVLYNFDFITSPQIVLIGIVVLTIIGVKIKVTNKLMHLVSNRSEKINALINQLKQFNLLELKSEEGKKYKEALFGSSGIYEGLSELIEIKKRSEFRMNVLVGVLLNYLFAWDFHLLVKAVEWYKKYADKLEDWEEKLAEIEVWTSGAIYNFNTDNTCIASNNEKNEFEIIALRHPFVVKEKQIPNDFILKEDESFLITTGPNMAGKSTFLRSVGLAIISANAGFPILADSCAIPEVNLYSSMRTSDDLTVESSYFHAELTRLRFIMDAIEEKGNVFVILDEILKGTNSKDKEIGSAGFLEKLNRVGAKGIIATHDLSLTELAKDKKFKNVYFDSTIENEELSFDYKIRDGVCKNMNASFLLKKMKLVD